MIPLTVVTQAHNAGLCVVPPAQDGTKRPNPPGEPRWKKYQDSRPEVAVLQAWYDPRNGLTGIGVITGKVSGNLEALDFDTRAGWEQYRDLAGQCGLLPLLDRLWHGYGELSPRGVHVLYRCETISGSTKLAKDAEGKVFIETRGEGGYIIIAPSNGTVHPSGDEYRTVSGSLATIVTITAAERLDLWTLAKSLDQGLLPAQPIPDPLRSSSDPANRPGEAFNHRASWTEVLEPHGWTRVFTREGTTYWRRPGKKDGLSATTGHAGTDYLYVFTSNSPLDSGRAYSKFGAYAVLNHGGDFRAATSALGKAGYGEPARTLTLKPPLRSVPGGNAPADSHPRDSPSPRPPLIPLAEYIARPRTAAYLIKGVLPALGLGQLFGDSNVGKSFLAIDMGCHLAQGLAWRGHRVKQTGVVYVAAEGLAGLQARFCAWCQQMGEVPDRFWIREYPVGLTVGGASSALVEDIEQLPHPVGLIILDTLAGNFGVGSENDAADMAAALVGLKTLGMGRMILDIHHTGHADKTRGRGHSSLLAALDVELLAAKPSEDGPLMLTHTKCRDFDRMAPLAFRIDKVELPWADDDGEPVNSAMVVAADAEEIVPPVKEPSQKEQQALDLLREMYAGQAGNLGANGTPRVTAKDWYEAMTFEKDRAHRYRLRQGLVSKGLIFCDSGYVYLR